MEDSQDKRFIQLIVKSQKLEDVMKQLQGKATIKYKLPMIHSYVLEVEARPAKVLLESVEDSNDVVFEMDTKLKAQMKRANEIIHSDFAHKQGILGTGVGVAILDTGIYLHPDLTFGGNRVLVFKDFVNGRRTPYDDNGHGTHVAGIVGGNGHESNGEYSGVAPDCNIIALKVLNHKGNGNVSDVLAALQWVIDHKEEYNIRIVNISVGTTSNDGIDEESLLVKGVNAVWDAGVVVVVAAGNNGPKPKSISTPGISRKVITVGASDDDIPVEISGGKSSDYSGRGPTFNCIKKPDLVAPGSNIVSCNVQRNSFSLFAQKHNNSMYTTKSGTSMATPIVSGAVALLLSKYPEMTPQEVKIRFKMSSTDLGEVWSKQGWGLLNVKEMLR
ncbi:alkaline serine protease [Lachnospiraceae bacterium KM106-2]|nr:alkaline serine protease [Lachnospiraceae bacterium KM106-2]